MRRNAWTLGAWTLAVLAVWPLPAAAQQAGGSLTQNEQLGRQLFTQSCSVCHTRPSITAGLYGPQLSRDAAGGQADVMHGVIANGTPRMPGFKYQFTDSQIDALVAYLKTLPPPVASSGGSTKSDMD